eukprot:gb/GEZN01008470.1/.p1 GENE.gb/GEZN01008470.1/~~gb/GEZN01008470.1/.p1  ORF type:complete len:205 (-),score=29.87 gb/GEZN01008470.1/:650-1264(-)
MTIIGLRSCSSNPSSSSSSPSSPNSWFRFNRPSIKAASDGPKSLPSNPSSWHYRWWNKTNDSLQTLGSTAIGSEGNTSFVSADVLEESESLHVLPLHGRDDELKLETSMFVTMKPIVPEVKAPCGSYRRLDLDALNEEGESLLMRAVKDVDAILVQRLLERGANASFKSLEGHTALALAWRQATSLPACAQPDNQEIIRLLKED